ncbi:DUF4309 domain-containing protein [Thermoflavimicrobium dichotomicum]|uniref:DUF4309 domain-containing protein n=1 Tax=Thermoflavimicrobium dichotomicum TaxID=46223 RepID=A0A1I3KCX8_9BACL|nr:DUF4309 domain-containing protein [Thermoflavimicrobium dichotomicum]SFI70055.1 protein of unknown function [Thermoflavimicrobium dichotomicum]
MRVPTRVMTLFFLLSSFLVLSACNDKTEAKTEESQNVASANTNQENNTTTENKNQGPAETNQEKKEPIPAEQLLPQVKQLAMQGKVINCEFALGTPLSTVKEKYGKPDQAVGHQVMYEKQGLFFYYTRNSQIVYYISSADERYKNITMTNMKQILGKPDANVSTEALSFLYYAGNYQVIFHFNPRNKELLSIDINDPKNSILYKNVSTKLNKTTPKTPATPTN